jgi:hypothetical protein
VQAPESQLHEKLGGLEAMDKLIDVSSAESETKVIKFANKLSFALRSSVEYEFLLQVWIRIWVEDGCVWVGIGGVELTFYHVHTGLQDAGPPSALLRGAQC